MGPDDPYGLEVRVHRHRSDESHAASLEVLGDPVGELAVRDSVFSDDRAVRPSPYVVGERPEFLGYLQERLRVAYRGNDLGAVPHDSRIGHEPFNILVAVSGHGSGVESVERPAERLPLVEDAFPRKPCLEAFQDEHLVQPGIIVRRDPPFRVMIPDVCWIGRIGPWASAFSIGPGRFFYSHAGISGRHGISSFDGAPTTGPFMTSQRQGKDGRIPSVRMHCRGIPPSDMEG